MFKSRKTINKSIHLTLMLSMCILSIFVTACNKVERGYKEDDVDTKPKFSFSSADSNYSYVVDSSSHLCVNGVQKVKLTEEELNEISVIFGKLGQGNIVENINEKGLTKNQSYIYSQLPNVLNLLSLGEDIYSDEASDPAWKQNASHDYDNNKAVTYREFALSVMRSIDEATNQ